MLNGANAMIDRDCQTCGKTFLVHPSRVKHGRGLNCSRECQYKSTARHRVPHVTLKCHGCGSSFSLVQSKVVAKRGAGKFCSRVCRDKHWTGPLTPNWQNGTGVSKRGPYWYAIRRRVLKRDGACLHCGSTNNLHVHHIIPFRMFLDHEQANAEANLIALCSPCHRKEESRAKWVLTQESGSVLRFKSGGVAWNMARERGMI